MSKHYVTSEVYGGQRASVGRIVVVKYNDEILAGVIVAISMDGERPIIRMLSDESPGRNDSAFGFRPGELAFEDVKSPDDIRKLVNFCWFWPPRVGA